MPKRKEYIKCTCKMCGIEFERPAYYIKIHGGAYFHDRECQKKYRRINGLMSSANEHNKELFTKILQVNNAT